MKTEHFGIKLASLRGKHRMGQKEVSAYLKIPQESYSRMERSAKRPAPAKLEELAKLYKMSIKELEEYEPPSTTTNHFYEQVLQVNHIGHLVISGIDKAIEKMIKEPDLWNGEAVTLSITFQIKRKEEKI